MNDREIASTLAELQQQWRESEVDPPDGPGLGTIVGLVVWGALVASVLTLAWWFW
jgi:hypothetical protein